MEGSSSGDFVEGIHVLLSVSYYGNVGIRVFQLDHFGLHNCVLYC